MEQCQGGTSFKELCFLTRLKICKAETLDIMADVGQNRFTLAVTLASMTHTTPEYQNSSKRYDKHGCS
jgi:hypothetical protein